MISPQSYPKSSYPIVVRQVALTHVHFPVKFKHGHIESKHRLTTDKSPERVDILTLNIFIDYVDNHNKESKSLDGLFNYSDLYEKFCSSSLFETEQSLEVILDNIVDEIDIIAKNQNISLYQVKVEALRNGLDVSCPLMKVVRTFQLFTSLPVLNESIDYRQSGDQRFPLYVSIKHEWIPEDGRIEHLDTRFEALMIHFNVTYRWKKLNGMSLDGLFNYVPVVNYLYHKQGFQLTDSLESITDELIDVLVKECEQQKVKPMVLECKLERTGFPKALPVIGIKKFFEVK